MPVQLQTHKEEKDCSLRKDPDHCRKKKKKKKPGPAGFWNVYLSCHRAFRTLTRLQQHIRTDHHGASTKVFSLNKKDLTPCIQLKRCSNSSTSACADAGAGAAGVADNLTLNALPKSQLARRRRGRPCRSTLNNTSLNHESVQLSSSLAKFQANLNGGKYKEIPNVVVQLKKLDAASKTISSIIPETNNLMSIPMEGVVKEQLDIPPPESPPPQSAGLLQLTIALPRLNKKLLAKAGAGSTQLKLQPRLRLQRQMHNSQSHGKFNNASVGRIKNNKKKQSSVEGVECHICHKFYASKPNLIRHKKSIHKVGAGISGKIALENFRAKAKAKKEKTSKALFKKAKRGVPLHVNDNNIFMQDSTSEDPSAEAVPVGQQRRRVFLRLRPRDSSSSIMKDGTSSELNSNNNNNAAVHKEAEATFLSSSPDNLPIPPPTPLAKDTNVYTKVKQEYNFSLDALSLSIRDRRRSRLDRILNPSLNQTSIKMLSPTKQVLQNDLSNNDIDDKNVTTCDNIPDVLLVLNECTNNNNNTSIPIINDLNDVDAVDKASSSSSSNFVNHQETEEEQIPTESHPIQCRLAEVGQVNEQFGNDNFNANTAADANADNDIININLISSDDDDESEIDQKPTKSVPGYLQLGIKSYKCPTCPRVFIYKTSLAAHNRKSHVQQQFRYKCIQCDIGFNQLSDLASHDLIFHRKELSCQVYFQPPPLVQPENALLQPGRVERQRKFKCGQCYHYFTNATALKKHMDYYGHGV